LGCFVDIVVNVGHDLVLIYICFWSIVFNVNMVLTRFKKNATS